MNWGVLTWILVAVGALVAFFVVQLLHLSGVLAWQDQATRGIGYYGRSPAGRERFKRSLRFHARLLRPMLRLLTSAPFTFDKTSFQHRGISGPQGTCSKESFAAADRYAPRPEDVFVVTQMKCGTTWMQHVVYEVLNRGAGNLVESGTALYAVAPWLEAMKSVSVDDAPLIGTERPSRVIKTHLPASHCPYRAEARYIYVARHPVSCFASCADFIATNVGGMQLALGTLEDWFCSVERMWWGPWPDHVRGWWERSQAEDNVLFVTFEEMKRDLPAVIHQVTAFLGMQPLTDAELEQVRHKCGFAYMQEHRDAFEMHPPHLLAINAEMFVRGTSDRYKDVPPATRERILAWCAARLTESAFPLGRLYPEAVKRV